MSRLMLIILALVALGLMACSSPPTPPTQDRVVVWNDVLDHDASTTLAAGSGIINESNGKETEDIEPDAAQEVTYEDENTFPLTDHILIADQTGLSVEEVARRLDFQDEFGEYAGSLKQEFPDQISGVWLDSPPGTVGPNTRGNVRFTGTAPPGLELMDNVVYIEGGMISIKDQKRRQTAATQAVKELGYRSYVTFFNHPDNVIRIELILPEGTRHPSVLDLAAALQKRLAKIPELQGRAARVEPDDIDLIIFTGTGPSIKNEPLGGGN